MRVETEAYNVIHLLIVIVRSSKDMPTILCILQTGCWLLIPKMVDIKFFRAHFTHCMAAGGMGKL